jgi:hypothetical protein
MGSVGKKINFTKKQEENLHKYLMNLIYEGSKKRVLNFKREFQKSVVTAALAAFGFLIALSWRDPISDSINVLMESLGFSGEGLLAGYASAIVLTILVVFLLMIISRWKVDN